MLQILLLGVLVPEAVAHVGTEPITMGALTERIAGERGQGLRRRPEAVLDVLIGETLLAQEGYRRGLARDDEVVARLAAERRRLAAERLLERELYAGLRLSDEMLRDLYHAGADEVRLERVVLASREQAEAALGRLAKGGSLEAEAEASLDPASKQGRGAVGWRHRSDLAGVEADAVFAATTGAWLGPIALPLGFAVVRVVERRVGDEAGLAAKRPSLQRYAEQMLRSQARTHYLQQLRAKQPVTIDEPFLRETGAALDGDAATLAHVVARVGKRTLAYGEVAAEVKRIFGGSAGGHGSGVTVKREVASSLVDRMLLEDAALARGLDKEPEVAAALAHTEHELVGAAYLFRLRRAVPATTPAAIEAFYTAHVGDYRIQSARRCAHLVVGNLAEAERLRKKIAGGARFDEVARASSIDAATRDSGGSLGELDAARLAALGQHVPSLAEALREAKPGVVGAPVESPMGFHLVRCDAPAPARTPPLAEVRADVEVRAAGEEAQAAVEKRVAELRKSTPVTIDRDALGRASATEK